MTSQSEIHNLVAAPMVHAIVRPVLDNGGRHEDVLVLLESITAAVLLICTKEGSDEAVLQAFTEGVAKRMAEMRAMRRPAAGPKAGDI
jgi:hypothetical protein